MKLRNPTTFDGAIHRITGLLTAEACGAALQPPRSGSLVKKWGDEDCEQQPSLSQAFALDEMFVREVGGEGPIMTVWKHKLLGAAKAHVSMEATDRLCDALHAIGDLAGEVRAASLPTSPGGAAIVPMEATRILAAISEAEDQLAKLRRDVEARLAGEA